jgi:SSS family solute:Na+ symporter
VYHWIHVLQKTEPLGKADMAFTFALGRFAPAWGVRGIVMAGLIAAVMAALSAQVNSASTLFSADLYKKLIHKSAGDREMVRVGRSASFTVLLLAALISPVVGYFGIFKFFQFALTAIAIPFMATILMGILWKRVNYAAGLFGLVGGLVIQLALAGLFSGYVPPLPHLHFFYVGFIAQVVIMIGIVVVTLATAPPDPAKVAPYVWNLCVRRAYDDGLPRPWYQQVKFW